MSKNAALEERLAAVERDLAELKDRVFHEANERPWFERMIGSMRGFPEFEEVVKLGREIRKADAPE